MKLGDFFVELGIKSNSKSLKAVEEHINALKKLQKEVQREIQYEKELAEAQTEEQKARVKKKFAIEKEIDAEEENLKQQKASISNFKGMIRGAIGVATAVAGVVFAVDRMTTALARSNQKLINFQHQTGISLSTLNKYASANVSVNPLASIEGTAGSLQALASNLWDIQLGRGDVSAFQELSYFSGQEVSVYGKTVEEVIESVRSALTKIPNDVQATNLIQRMGFSPDDLMMLRMTREEFEKTQKLFLSASERKELEEYGKELNNIHLQIKLVYDRLVLKIFPIFNNLMKSIVMPTISVVKTNVGAILDILNEYPIVIKGIEIAIAALLFRFKPLYMLLSSIMIIIDDLVHYFTGGGSVLGVIQKMQQDKSSEMKNVNKQANPLDKIYTWGLSWIKDVLPNGYLKESAMQTYDMILKNASDSIEHNDNRHNTFNFYGINDTNRILSTLSMATGYNLQAGGGR